MNITIQLKEELADKSFTPQESSYWLPVLQASAVAIQQLNVLFSAQLVKGPLKSNPTSETIEGFLGEVNTVPNEFGVLQVALQYNALKIPYLPEEVPFIIYLGDSSEQKQIGIDAEGNPIYEIVIVGSFI